MVLKSKKSLEKKIGENMITDAKLVLSSEQAVTVDAASSNYIDVGQAENLGLGQDLTLIVEVAETAAGGTEGIQFELQSDTDSGFATDLKKEIISGILLPAVLTAGARFQFRLPANKLQRYLRLYYNVVTTAFSAGKFNAFITWGAVQQ